MNTFQVVEEMLVDQREDESGMALKLAYTCQFAVM
jgi:hypothetical protein